MGRNPLVMIVDERAPVRAEVQAMLAPARLAVVADCGYGVEASSLAEETRPNLVLVAIEEPIVRALQTVSSIRSILPNSPVIAYSSTTDFGVVRQVMQTGIRDLLPQPLKAGELLAAIENAMRNADAAGDTEAAPVRSAGTILTVFGAKGGIGKTTISTNLAAAIARDAASSVLIIDLDTRFGDVAIMMDVEPRFTVSEVATALPTMDRETFKSALVEHSTGVHILPAPRHPNEWRNVTAEEIKELVRFAARLFDYVILDTPGVFNDIVGAAIEVATQVLVITSVDMASIKDTSLMLDLLESESFPAERLFITVNHANGANSIRAADIQRVLHKEIFWELPHDSEVTLAAQYGKPVVVTKPHSRAGESFAGMACKITGKAPLKERRHFFRVTRRPAAQLAGRP